MALVPLILGVVTMAALWWYVVIPQQVAAEEAVTGVQQLGTPGLATAPAAPAEMGPPADFYMWFWIITGLLALGLVRYYWRMDAARFVVLKLLTALVRPLGILTLLVLPVSL